MMKYLDGNLYHFMEEQDNLIITKIITSKQFSVEYEEIDLFVERIFNSPAIFMSSIIVNI